MLALYNSIHLTLFILANRWNGTTLQTKCSLAVGLGFILALHSTGETTKRSDVCFFTATMLMAYGAVLFCRMA